MFQHTIQPRNNFFDLRLKEVWVYRDLLVLFVRRDFVAKYKQTILGPLWFLIRPIIQTSVMSVVFSRMANLSTDGMPPLLFYLAGVTSWSYFANCLTSTSNTFLTNAGLFGKVYFPRIIAPLSTIISNLIQFGIGLILFLLVYSFFLFKGHPIRPNITLLLLPVLIVLMGFMALGIGIMVSAMTTKYRDLQFLITFGMQLWMYATPVILPLSAIPEKYKPIMLCNPMTGIVETFKFGFLGNGAFSWSTLLYPFIFTIGIFIIGLLIFNKTEKNFMDTV